MCVPGLVCVLQVLQPNGNGGHSGYCFGSITRNPGWGGEVYESACKIFVDYETDQPGLNFTAMSRL